MSEVSTSAELQTEAKAGCKRAASVVEESENENGNENQESKRIKLNIPEGISKKEWKRQQRRLKYEAQKEEYKEQRREKKKEARHARSELIRKLKENGEPLPESTKRERTLKPEEQTHSKSRIVIDCSFDDLMNDKEVISLSSQITRSYAANKRSKTPVDLIITSLDKRLKQRFDKDLSHYKYWTQNVEIHEENIEKYLQENIDDKQRENVIYLSADTDEILETLEPNFTYVVGGIVDKGRHKHLCANKAKELGLKMRRLPIDEYIKLSGRRVLATSHVVELLLKWFEFKDWKTAFEMVLPEHFNLMSEKPPPSYVKDDRKSSGRGAAAEYYNGSSSHANYYPPQQPQYNQQFPNSRGYPSGGNQQGYYQQPPQGYYQQPGYYPQQPQYQQGYYQQQQPVYVQQQEPRSGMNEGCLASCLAMLCVCFTLDMLF